MDPHGGVLGSDFCLGVNTWDLLFILKGWKCLKAIYFCYCQNPHCHWGLPDLPPRWWVLMLLTFPLSIFPLSFASLGGFSVARFWAMRWTWKFAESSGGNGSFVKLLAFWIQTPRKRCGWCHLFLTSGIWIFLTWLWWLEQWQPVLHHEVKGKHIERNFSLDESLVNNRSQETSQNMWNGKPWRLM